MSYFSVLNFFREKTIRVACPECAFVTEHDANKVRRNSPLICRHCGSLFLAKEKSRHP